MKTNYLFPHSYKKIGWAIFFPTAILGLLDFEPKFLNFRIPAFYSDKLLGNSGFFRMIENNILNELIGILLIISLLFIAFARLKHEDEYISKIRLDSLVWAVYVNYIILALSILLIYGLPFLNVMLYNMFTILIFFIIRFHWMIYKTRKGDKS